MAGPPFPSQNVPVSQFWLYLPNHFTILGLKCFGKLIFYLICLQRKQAERLSGWLAGKLQNYMSRYRNRHITHTLHQSAPF
jgi:hypothetical protein